MLTKNDLFQIKNIVEGVVEQKLEEKLEQKLEEKLEQKLEEKLEPIREQLKELKPMSKKISKLQEGQKTIISYFDNKAIHLEERIEHVESLLHVNRSPLR